MAWHATPERGRSFDRVAEQYERFRHGHAAQVAPEIERLAGLRPPGPLLEIGCGPGQAGLPFAERGYRNLAIELGAAMAGKLELPLETFLGVARRCA